jgi:hypothetical protein
MTLNHPLRTVCILLFFVFLSGVGFAQIPVDFPPVSVNVTGAVSEGNIYAANFSYTDKKWGSYAMKLDDAGRVIFQRASSSRLGSMDFHPWPGGQYSYYDERVQGYIILNSAFQAIDTFFTNDDHEFRFLPNGNAIFLGRDTTITDLSSIGGLANAKVVSSRIMEVSKNHELVFEWRSKDHFQVQDAIHETIEGADVIDAFHANSIDLDQDGNILLSSRSLDAVLKIDHKTGEVLWQWGGSHDNFTWNDTLKFSGQHDVRRLANGHITVFDNGNFRPVQFSRAVEYILDEENKTATKVWEFRRSPKVYAPAMGSVQRLSNGNTLIGWGLGSDTMLTEVTADGAIVLAMGLPNAHFSYRVYKFTDKELSSVVSHEKNISFENCYPNPSSGSSIIRFSIPERMHIRLSVSDPIGREIRTLFDGISDAGDFSAPFEGKDLPAGLYLCKLVTPSATLGQTLVLIK